MPRRGPSTLGLLGLCATAAFASGLVLSRPARASGDFGCGARLTLIHPEFDGCNNMVVLSPGNDTRTNLLLLRPGRVRSTAVSAPEYRFTNGVLPVFTWSDLSRWTFGGPPDVGAISYASGQGSRCRSNETGTADFVAAVRADPRLSADDKRRLTEARLALKPTCGGAASVVLPNVGAGGRSAEFGSYLAGASAFYAGDFECAAVAFSGLASSGNAWLNETALYMRARVEVNRAQVGLFDKWGYRDAEARPDPAVLAAVEAGLRRYLAAYPAGRYAGSARGLFRRLYWFAGDSDRLAAAYKHALAVAPASDTALIEEIDDKLFSRATRATVTDPLLLATLDLQAMRADGETVLSRAELEGQRDRFGTDRELYDTLLAAQAFYVAARPADVLRLIPDAAQQHAFSDRQFSRQVLRGLALDALNDPNARGFWLEMLPGATAGLQRLTLELAIAFHDERHDGLNLVFAPDSPVKDPTLRDTLLTNVADPVLLRREARAGGREGRVALFTLLYKGLTRGRYAEFSDDLSLVAPVSSSGGMPDWYIGTGEPPLGVFARGDTQAAFACPSLRATARALAGNSQAISPRLCLGEFVRLNGFDGFFLDVQPPNDELGGTPTRFPGRPFSRGEAYKSILNGKTSSPDESAYALYRAVECYAPAGINTCGGADESQDQRRRWFERLHRQYPASRWANESRYYW